MKTKDRRSNRPPLTPPYPRRGIAGLPSSDEEGLGVVGLCILRAHFAFACNWVSDIEKWRNKARMYMKTKNKYKKSLIPAAQALGSAVCGFPLVAGAVAPPGVSGV